MPASAPTQMKPQALKIVRFAMFVFLLVFGALGYIQGSKRVETNPDQLQTMRWVGYGFCVAITFAVAFVRGMRAKAPPEGRTTLSLVGSALGEAAALFGAVIMLTGGEPWIYAVGLLLFFLTWAILPADPDVV
jgi:FtsH-binding integral membrane protein